MERNELIFFIIAIIAYFICAFALNIPQSMHIMFVGILIAILLIIVLVKYQKRFENEKISKIAKITAILLFILAIITSTYELLFEKTLLINSTTIFPVFIVVLICMWFFEKNEN